MKVRIQVRGRTYTVRSDEDDVDLAEVARYVDARMAEVAGQGPLDEYTVALLAALNIAGDFQRFRARTDARLAELERRLASTGVLLDAALPPDEDG